MLKNILKTVLILLLKLMIPTVLFKVKDEGIGIPEEDQPFI
jgi:signal transduction histidine kinase